MSVSPLAAVGGADLDLRLLVEHVELGEGQRVEPVHADGVAHDHGVEPPAAPRAAGGGAEFVPLLADLLLQLAADLGGQRPRAHARRVGLGDADDPSTRVGGTPSPVSAPPAVADEDVTNG